MLADLVVYPFSSFGAKPSLVLKSGMIAYAQMGDPNASIPTVQPVFMRPMFAASVPGKSVTFVSGAGLEAVRGYGLKKRIEAVKGCNRVGKKDMKFNDYMPVMKVDPESYKVEADGVHCTVEPAETVAVGQMVSFPPFIFGFFTLRLGGCERAPKGRR